MSPPGDDHGFVLILVLLALLALTAVAHGGLALARQQRLAGRAGVAALQARLTAQSTVRAAAARIDPSTAATLREDGSMELPRLALAPGTEGRARIERLRAEWLWIEASARARSGALVGRRTTAALFWSLEGPARIGDLRGALEQGGGLRVEGAELVRGSGTVGAPGEWPDRICAPHAEVLDSVLGARGLDPVARGWASGESAPEMRSGLDGIPRLGLLDGRALDARATIALPGGDVRPGPVVGAGGCLSGRPTNWGSPDEPEGPCGDRHPLVVVDGDLRMGGGAGQGVLAVSGDVRMVDGARFVGLVLVGGDLEVGEGARVQGAARVRGSVRVSGVVEGSPCAVLRALEGPATLLRPLPLPGQSWLAVPPSPRF